MFLGPTARLSHGVGDKLFCAHTGHMEGGGVGGTESHEYSQKKRLSGHDVGLGGVLGWGRILWPFLQCSNRFSLAVNLSSFKLIAKES